MLLGDHNVNKKQKLNFLTKNFTYQFLLIKRPQLIFNREKFMFTQGIDYKQL
jgi:hypothetical protein